MNESQVFANALRLATPVERAAYLDDACAGDAGLRAAVEGLLRARDSDPDFLEPPATAPTGSANGRAAADRPGALLAGRYKLLEEIGEGGMGTVWLAQQSEPVRRAVAVKLIKPGMDSKTVLARFEAERQAFALMDHPNIAKVHDAGIAPDGRPFFVMELVKGVPITRYCDEHRLNPRQRLELFVAVCHAVQHAHQKGVIHRDLKPSNVLVARYDDRPVPKVIDFGVAKATGLQLTEATLHTGFGAVVGTVEYMSPEQATFNQLDIDTRSDVYSLGVLLYELLTGTTPLDCRRRTETPLLELLRMVREDDTVPPSTRLSTLGDLPAVAASRGVEPRKLSWLLRGELDWIVMKALEKDRNRRYESASGLAQDVERYLADEPVLACPPSATYRLKKFARRNKGRLAAAAMVLFCLVFLGSAFGWLLGDRAARQGRTGARVDSILSEVEGFEREHRWPEALVGVRRAETAVAGGEADEATARRVRDWLTALEFIDRLEQLRMELATVVDGKFDYAGLDREYARAFREFGVDVDALPVEASVERLRARPAHAVPLAAALDDWVSARRQLPGQEVAVWQPLVAVARGVDPEPVRDRLRAFRVQHMTRAEAEELRRLAETLDVRRSHPATVLPVARHYIHRKQLDLAARLLRGAQHVYPTDFWLNLELSRTLTKRKDPWGALRFAAAAVALRPNAALAHINLGAVLVAQGQFEEGVTCCRKATELDPNSVHAHNGLAYALVLQKRFDEAVSACRTVIALDPKNVVAYCNLSVALRGQKKLEEAVAECRRAVEIDPESVPALMALGDALGDQKKRPEAIACYRKAVDLEPGIKTHSNLGVLLFRDRQFDEAIFHFHQAIEFDPEAAGLYLNLGNALYAQNKVSQAIASYRRAIDLEPQNAMALSNLGYALRHTKPDDALAYVRKALALDAAVPNGHYHLGAVLWHHTEYAEAVTAFREADRLDPGNFEYLFALGHALRDSGRPAEAVTVFRQAVEVRPDDPKGYQFLAVAAQKAGRPDQVVEAMRGWVRVRPGDPAAHAALANALRADDRLDEAIVVMRFLIGLEKKPGPASPNRTLTQFQLAELLNDRAWQLTVGSEEKTRDPKRALDLIEEAVALLPNDAAFRRTQGAALCRAENWTAATTALEKARQLNADYQADSLALFFLSMARQRLNDTESAGRHFDEAVRWRMGMGATDNELRLVCAEAAALLGREVPPAFKEGQPLPPGPKLVNPASGATVTNGAPDGSKPIVWEFDWADVPDATRYHLVVIGPRARFSSVNRSDLTGSSFRYEANAWIADQHRLGRRWKVRALVGDVWTDWSEERTFDVAPLVKPTTRPGK